MSNPDPRAVQATQAVQTAQQADLTILFGSRARGDHREPSSDIDIMLVQDEAPEDGRKQLAAKEAERAAREIYGRDVTVQLVWRTKKEFRLGRRYTNSVETRAMREGTIMPRDPESYSAQDYEDENTEHEFDWSPYNERLRHAEVHLSEFVDGCERGKDDLIIGQQAQNAMEHAMKALLEAQSAKYRRTHDIGELLGNIRHSDRQGHGELENFRLSIRPQVYTAYEGGDEYERRTEPLLTEFPDFQEKTRQDVETIIERARQVRARKETEGG